MALCFDAIRRIEFQLGAGLAETRLVLSGCKNGNVQDTAWLSVSQVWTIQGTGCYASAMSGRAVSTYLPGAAFELSQLPLGIHGWRV